MANLVCGSIAVIVLSDCTVNGMGYWPALLFLAAFFDLLDGAVARALGVSGEMGKQLDREGLNSVNHRTVVSTARKLALLAKATAVAVKAPALPDVPLSPVPAIHYLVDIVSCERHALGIQLPWTVPSRSFDQRVAWMVDLFSRLEQRERAER